MKDNEVLEIGEQEFGAEVLRSTQTALVGFLAGWSKPCQLVEPVLEEVAKDCDGTARVFKVNVDDNPDLGNIFAIQSVPTLIYFVNGHVSAKIVGMASAKAILTKLNSLTSANTPARDSERSQ
ncbi:MAG TPA: thioredoxin domain-containing protein [Verrucomicrobiae bacterium]|nr:thioredoxin domain-containing protein [Verrucomicrobiae bacterium]